MKLVHLAASVAALVLASNASAQEAEIAIGTVALKLPVPSGFCLPEGEAVHMANRGAATDKDNVTLATFYACTQMASGSITDYFLLKTPRGLLNEKLTREEVLAQFAAELSDPAFSAERLSRDSSKTATDSATEVNGTPTQVQTSILPLGGDAECSYMGGLVTASIGAASTTLNVAGCITAVQNRFVMVFRYSKGTAMSGAAKLIPSTRHVAMSIKPR